MTLSALRAGLVTHDESGGRGRLLPMSRTRRLSTALGGALLDGAWNHHQMVERLQGTFGTDRPWMRSLAIAARRGYREPPLDAPRTFARWITTRRSFREALLDPLVVRRWPTPVSRMGDRRWDVPAIDSPGDLARWLEISMSDLEVLADRRRLSRSAPDRRMRHYWCTWIPKRSGGLRLLEAPKPQLKEVQRRILRGILERIPPDGSTHGFHRGRSVLGFAEAHTGKAAVLRMDLRSFFPSVFASRVFGIFRTAGYPESVSGYLAALCTHATPEDVLREVPQMDGVETSRLRTPHLPQGAPTSGALANLAAYRLDRRLGALCGSLRAEYGRYADDLVISGGGHLLRRAPDILARVAAIAAEEGFCMNFRKSRVMASSRQQRITGLVVNEKRSLPRRDHQKLEAILYNCVRHGPADQNREAHPDFREYLRGRVGWALQVDPVKGARLRMLFEAIVW